MLPNGCLGRKEEYFSKMRLYSDLTTVTKCRIIITVVPGVQNILPSFISPLTGRNFTWAKRYNTIYDALFALIRTNYPSA